MSDSTVTAPWEQAADVATRGNGQPETLPGLLPHHAKRLQEESGLSPETIAAAGIYSEAAPVKLGTLLNRRQYPKKCAPALVIPYRHADGREMGYHRVRPDNPRMQLRRPVKYESEPGRAPEPYFPPLVAVVIANLAALLLITE
ncbi:MAG: hypothetical protein HQ582_32465 [Planctomycetes bacterium]|nr:hypothetical protein [Planctomycetota bacterium]